MKFCSKCGKHYKDSDTFCKDCGIKLTQGAADSSGLADLKESASQALSEASSKAKEAFSEENRQKLQEKASAAAGNVSRFQALSANAKKIIAAIIVILLALGCYEYFSPEKQVERALTNSIQVLTEVSSKSPDEYTDSDIKKLASIYPEAKRDTITKAMQKTRDYVLQHPGEKANSDFMRGLGTDLLSNVKVKSVTIQGNRANVTLVNKNGARIGVQPMKKVDGDWYMMNLPGDRD